MNPRQTLLGALWLFSVLAVYFFPRSAGSVSIPTSPGQVISSASAEPGATAPVLSGQDDPETPAQRLRRLVGQARLQAMRRSGFSQLAPLRLFTFLEQLDDAEILPALAEVETTVRDVRQKGRFYEYLLGRWAERDGAAAMTYLDDHGELPFLAQRKVRVSIIRSWAAQDAPSAWAWLRTHHRRESMGDSDPILVAAFAAMGASDFPFAVRCLSEVDQTRITRVGRESINAEDDAIQGLARSAIDDRSRQRLLEASASLPLSQRSGIQTQMLGEWVESDADAALAWIDQQPAENRRVLRELAVMNLMKTNPQRAAGLALEDAQNGSESALSPVWDWMVYQKTGFDAWLVKQPPNPVLDRLRATRIRRAIEWEPAKASEWVTSIHSEELRGELLQEIQKSRGSAHLPP